MLFTFRLGQQPLRLRIQCVLLALVVCLPVGAAGAVESNKNFIVFVSDDAPPDFAAQVLAHAEKFRQDIAIEWFGGALPPSVGRSVVNVKLSRQEDKGLTWAIDDPRRTLHTVYLNTSAENALGSTLQHEIAHVVMATHFPQPNRLPTWLEEGVASRYDNDERRGRRDDVMNWLTRTGNWPELRRVLDAPSINANDELSYSVASSLVKYLLTQGDKKQLLQFAAFGQRNGWDRAVNRSYQFANVDKLQTSWQIWVSEQNTLAQVEQPGVVNLPRNQ